MKNLFFLSVFFLLLVTASKAQSVDFYPGFRVSQTSDQNITRYDLFVRFAPMWDAIGFEVGLRDNYVAGYNRGDVPLPDYLEKGEITRVNRKAPYAMIYCGTFAAEDPFFDFLNFNVFLGVIGGRPFNWGVDEDGNLIYFNKSGLNGGVAGLWGVEVGPKVLLLKKILLSGQFRFEKPWLPREGTPNGNNLFSLSVMYRIGK